MDFLTEAFKILKARRVSEDALQEAFCRLWSKKLEPKSEGEAIGMLAVASRNIEIDEYRRRRRRPEVELSENLMDDSPGDARDKERIFRQVEDLVDEELTPLQRTIIRRHEYDGVQLEQIAVELGMQATAVRMQLSRARKTLRNSYRKEYE